MIMNEIIRSKRKELNFTQEQIANYLGITTPAVNKWEKGSTYPDITLLPGLARLLKIDLNTLMSFNDNLTDIEIKHIIIELENKIEKQDYDTGFQFAISIIRDFPTCEDLIFPVALSLSSYLSTLPVSEQAKYKDEIEHLYSRLIQSETIEIRKEAVYYLFAQYCERKEFDQAEKLLDNLPIDKKVLLATLYMEKGNYNATSKLLEQRLFEDVIELQTILTNMTKIALLENNMIHAKAISDILSAMINLFDLMDCTAFTTQLDCAVKQKNQEQSLLLLSSTLNSMRKKWNINDSILYQHLDLSSANAENFSSLLLPTFIGELETDGELDFLRENETFKQLLKQHKKGTE